MEPVQSFLYFNGVHIIESLRHDDEKTGQNLFERSIKDKPQAYPDLEVDLAVLETADDFWAYLNGLRDRVVREDYNPIIHIEAHGDEDGIQLTSMECIDWHHLIAVLTDINAACNMNLLVAMSACKGGHFTKMVSPMSRAPVFGILGPLVDIEYDELEAGFGAFYDELFSSFDINAALNQMRDANPDIDFNYELSNARDIFFKSYLRYRQDAFTPAAMTEREDRFIEMARESDHEARYYLDSTLRKIFREQIDNRARREERFELLKKSFFMCDLYPDNYDRFRIGDVSGEL